MHIVSLPGCAAGASACDTVLLPRASGGLCVQKSAGDVIQVLVHWMWNLDGLGVAAALNL